MLTVVGNLLDRGKAARRKSTQARRQDILIIRKIGEGGDEDWPQSAIQRRSAAECTKDAERIAGSGILQPFKQCPLPSSRP
jgi:hypothetical protein